MPRRQKGTRLHLKPASGTRRAHWIIKDGEKRISTGCRADDIEGAREALARYLARTHTPPDGEEPLITEVIAIYRREVEPNLARPDLVQYSVKHLVEFWGDFVSAIKGPRCRAYVKWRCAKGVSVTTARHDLKTLRAAIRYYHEEYGLKTLPVVKLPPKEEGRVRWLTRQEAARLLRSAKAPHLRRFILIGLYTGMRSQATLGLSWVPSISSGWIDLQSEVLYRRGETVRRTKKNQNQKPTTIPNRLMAHLRRWHRMDAELGVRYVCHYQGTKVRKLRRSWDTARTGAGLGEDVVPHTLRHTAATWLMQRGVKLWEAAGYLGMTEAVLNDIYGHHHPDHQKEVKNAFGTVDRGGRLRANAK
jgi:integrase